MSPAPNNPRQLLSSGMANDSRADHIQSGFRHRVVQFGMTITVYVSADDLRGVPFDRYAAVLHNLIGERFQAAGVVLWARRFLSLRRLRAIEPVIKLIRPEKAGDPAR